MGKLDLSGSWKINLKGEEKDFILPGTACENKIGVEKSYYSKYCKEAVRTAIEKFEYIGELTLIREIDLPDEANGKCIKLFMERVNVSSRLFIDGVEIGRQIIGLSTPHIYDLTGKINPGRHIIKLVLDNSDLLNLSNMSSGYSADTQGYWNGVIGKIQITWEDICHVEDIQVYPKEDGKIDLKLSLHTDQQTPEIFKDAKIEIAVKTPEGKKLDTKCYDTKMYATLQYCYLSYDLKGAAGEIKWWDEFTPGLYEISAKLLVDGQAVDEKTTKFGMRILKAQGKHIFLNGRRVGFRGNVDCAQFPKTGYPPMDRDVWEHNLGAIKEWGLNLVRFHGWCPPEVAFQVADEIGLYVQVEMPLWLNADVTKIELGDDPAHESFFMGEAAKIIKTYGNHPSFIFFSNGNENMGDYRILEDITRMVKSLDDRHLYAITSNFDHPITPVEDYFLAQKAFEKPVRIQNLHDQVAVATDVNFDQVAQEMPVPFMSFEVGQYGVYPNVDIIDDYDGNMLPVNFDAIKKSLIEAGVFDRREEYIKASGDMCYRLYKEDVEAVYRTKDMSGYQLLCIQDYSGQYTATVGILDVMYRDKGIVTKEKWHEFVGPVVPLFKAKRIFKNTEKLQAQLDLYDYGKEKIKEPVYEIVIRNNGDVIYQTKQTKTDFEFDLTKTKAPACLEVEVQVDGHKNHWHVYVYPENQLEKEVNTKELVLENPVSSAYIPVFWSPVLFETDKPSGAIINEKHEIFKTFPTGKYPDYQWKTLLDKAVGVDIAALGQQVEPIVELVPNYDCNKLAMVMFEGMYENKKALYCGFDLSADDLATKQLKKSIYDYVAEKDLTLVLCKTNIR